MLHSTLLLYLIIISPIPMILIHLTNSYIFVFELLAVVKS